MFFQLIIFRCLTVMTDMEPRSFYYFPRYSVGAFLVLFGIMSWVYNFDEILFHPPQGLHQWRQTDCLSLAYRYYEENLPFLEPAMHNLLADGTGKTISDFPLIYYSVAKIWQWVGPHTWIYRLLILAIFFWGMMAVLKLIESETANSLFGIFTAAILFTSPTLVYYSNNFLMNIPAFALACIGLQHFFNYQRRGQFKYLLYCTLAYLLGALLKSSALLTFVPIIFLFTTELLGVKWGSTKLFRHSGLSAILFGCLVITYLSWVGYASYYNHQHNAGAFLIGILPIWGLSSDQIQSTFEYIVHHFRWDYFRPLTTAVFITSGILVTFLFRKISRVLSIILLLTYFIGLVFCILFFEALKHHDYYVIDLFLIPVLVSLGAFKVIGSIWPRYMHSPWIYLALLFLLVHSTDFARRRMEERYSPEKKSRQHFQLYQAFIDIKPHLDKFGVKPADIVISPSDHAINISLYLMNRKGWTKYGTGNDPARIKKRIKMGAKYMLIGSPATDNLEKLEPFLADSIGSYQNITIYKLHENMAQ